MLEGDDGEFLLKSPERGGTYGGGINQDRWTPTKMERPLDGTGQTNQTQMGDTREPTGLGLGKNLPGTQSQKKLAGNNPIMENYAAEDFTDDIWPHNHTKTGEQSGNEVRDYPQTEKIGKEFLVDKTLDSNSSLIPGNLVSKSKLKIPKHQGDLGENPSLCATVLKLIDTRMFAVGYTDGSISFYNLQNFELIASTWRHKAAITSLEMLYTKDGSKLLISGSSEEEASIIIWDIRKPIRPIKRLKGHEHAISCIRELGDNSTIATASFDGKIVLWDVCNNFQCVQILDDNKGPVTC